MSIQKVNITDSSMISIIKTSIKEGKGLSLCRIGDGEIHILNRRLTPSLNKLFTTTFKYKDPNRCLEDSRKVLIDAIAKSDYIGIMGSNSISIAFMVKIFHITYQLKERYVLIWVLL